VNLNIFTEYPAWFILFCILLGAGYAGGLYYRERKSEFPDILKIFMAATRFIAISLISFLLLSPFLKTVVRQKEKPVIILAQDNSHSVTIGRDSTFYRNEYLSKLADLADGLSGKFDLKVYSFGEQNKLLSPGQSLKQFIDFKEKQTNISSLFSEIDNLYANRNVGAIVLASDGIYNTGVNPVYTAERLKFPVYTIALGDTNERKDLVLSKVNYNRLAYLNSKFPLEIIVTANDCEGQKSTVQVIKGNQPVYSQDFIINNKTYTNTFSLQLEAKEKGLQHYRIAVQPVPGELSEENNVKDIYIDVLDTRNRILILANSPHPDIAALKEAISSNYNYEVEDKLAAEFSGTLDKYNLVILHQLPSLINPVTKILEEATARKLPILLVIGEQTDLVRFNQMKPGVSVVGDRPIIKETLPEYNRNFALFTLNDKTIALFNDLPPLFTAAGNYQLANSANVLLFQRIGSITTSMPLVLFNETLDSRTGVITGEGIWKWRLMDYSINKDHQAFNEMVNKIVQFLGAREGRGNFRVYHQNNYQENERVMFDAEVYNESYELVNTPDVEITITNEENKQFPYLFSRTSTAYHLDAGSFPPGNYRYQAKVTLGEKTYTAIGEFAVVRLDIETLNTVADHSLLYKISSEHNGKMFYPGDLDALKSEILNRDDIRTVTYAQKRYHELINIPWVVAVIIGLLSLEWLLRKRAGGY
jgi:hypothetical protein